MKPLRGVRCHTLAGRGSVPRTVFALAAALAILAALPPVVHAQLVAAVLPSSRSVMVGTPATAFATIINSGNGTATACRLEPFITGFPATFTFQTTDPTHVSVGRGMPWLSGLMKRNRR